MSDKGSINNITLPVYKKITEETDAKLESKANISDVTTALATKADKILLSQIIYDTENNQIIFPAGVLPLRINTEDYQFMYFDYNNETVVFNDGSSANSWTLFRDENNRYVLDVEESVNMTVVNELQYVLFTGSSNYNSMNTYYLYHLFDQDYGVVYTYTIRGCSVYCLNNSTRYVVHIPTFTFTMNGKIDFQNVNSFNLMKIILSQLKQGTIFTIFNEDDDTFIKFLSGDVAISSNSFTINLNDSSSYTWDDEINTLNILASGLGYYEEYEV